MYQILVETPGGKREWILTPSLHHFVVSHFLVKLFDFRVIAVK